MPGSQQIYTIQELLSLRNNHTCEGLEEMAANPEIAEIVRTAGSKPSGSASCADSNTASKKRDSSNSSDEVVFKRNISRRNFRGGHRESIGDPVRHPGRGPVHQPVRMPVREPSREPVAESATAREAAFEAAQQHQHDLLSQEVPQQASQQLPQPGVPEQWKYRGRSDSEAASAEPSSAPTGIPAQKSEGFQRFFQAVVSPTHVRVTAGGRIVPNTRGNASPPSKRSTDTPPTDNQGILEKPTQAKPPVGPMGVASPIPMMPQYMQSYAQNFQPMPHLPHMQASMSFLPVASVPFGPAMAPNFAYGQNTTGTPALAMAQPASGGTLKDMHNMKPGDARSENGSASEKPDKVKLTPPEFFDCTKPFIYNGQYVMPVQAAAPFTQAMGGQMMPVHMVTLPHGMTSQQAGPFLQQPSAAGPHGMMAPPTGQFLQQPAVGAHPGMASQSAPQHFLHPLAGATPSAALQPAGQMLQPTSSRTTPSMNTTPFNAPNRSYASSTVSTGTHDPSMRSKVGASPVPPITSIVPSEITKKQIANFKQALKYNEDQLQFNHHQIDEKEMVYRIQVLQEHIKEFETKLQVQLAQEAEFRASQQKYGKSTSSPSDDENKASLQAAGTPEGYGAQESQEFIKDQKMLPSAAVFAPAFNPGGGASLTETSQRDIAKMVEPTEPARKSPLPRPKNNRLGVPYLLGALPKGKDPRTATDEDYVYTRPLTLDERRSRYLYWSKCPKDVFDGLPRFDGRHFYPPLPIEEEPTPSPQASPSRRVPVSRPELGYGFRGTRSEQDPFRPLTPVQKFGLPKQLMVSEDGYATARQYPQLSHPDAFKFSDSQQSSENGSMQEMGNRARGNRDSSAETAIMNIQERRPGGSGGAKLWPAMLKKASTSSAVSSTTAQGYLNATASLSPSTSIHHKLISPTREAGSPSKMSDFNDRNEGGALRAPSLEDRSENFPPSMVSSLEDQFRNISMGSADRHGKPGPFRL